MSYWQLQVFTASRLVLCPTIWFWCWRKRPRGMVAWMSLAFAYFLLTDHFDGQIARNQGLESELGYWLDHVGDLLFYGVVVLSIVKGSREPALARRRRAGGPPPMPPPSSATAAPGAAEPTPAPTEGPTGT